MITFTKHFEGEVDMRDFGSFKGYMVSPNFKYYVDYEGDFDMFFDTLEHAENAIKRIDEVYTLRPLTNDDISLKENEDIVSFDIYKCGDGGGEVVNGYRSDKMIIELY